MGDLHSYRDGSAYSALSGGRPTGHEMLARPGPAGAGQVGEAAAGAMSG